MTRLLAAIAAFLIAAPAMAAEIYYAPETSLDAIDVGLIDNAATSIDMAAYVLTDPNVIEALDNAADRGVRVRVILDPREHSAVDRMAGLELRRKLPGPLQHLKSFAVDGAVLRTGSANFSSSGERSQDNDLIVIRDPDAVSAFEAHFGRMWNAAVPAGEAKANGSLLRGFLSELTRRLK
jgi:phosphatidylserine/phosphatidylglycerophosphate/cardiolipin synthase-like enzyme